MKKLLIIFFSLGLTLCATAQPKIGGHFQGGIRSGGSHGGGVRYVRPRVTVIAPYARMYPYYRPGLSLGFGYSPFYDPFYNQRYETEPTQLDLQIEDIKNNYDYKISSAKDDKTLSKDERKQLVRDLKHQKDQEIIDAKKSYYSSKDQNSYSE